MQVNNLLNLSHKQLCSPKTGEQFCLSAVLSELFNLEKIFVHHDIILPNHRASSAHRHSDKEELILVLNGSPTLHLGNDIKVLNAGDFIGFAANSANHYLENKTLNKVEILVICSNAKNDKIIYEE